MLQKNNKGSILMMSLMIFSIISLICITCASLILSNNRIGDLEYKTEKLKEENIGAIEIINSNILKEINYVINNTKTEKEFYDYITKNNNINFINKAKNIQSSGLKNTYIEMEYDSHVSTKEFLHYKVLVKSKINNHDKYTLVKIKIKNHWFGIINKDTEEETKTEFDIVKENFLSENNKEDMEESDEIIEINEGNLITFYNYEEK